MYSVFKNFCRENLYTANVKAGAEPAPTQAGCDSWWTRRKDSSGSFSKFSVISCVIQKEIAIFATDLW